MLASHHQALHILRFVGFLQQACHLAMNRVERRLYRLQHHCRIETFHASRNANFVALRVSVTTLKPHGRALFRREGDGFVHYCRC